MARVLEAGSNGDVSEDTFFKFHKDYLEAKSLISSANAKMKAVKKRGADDGIDIQEYEYLRKRQSMTLEQRIKAHNNRTLYMKFLKMPEAPHIADIKEFSEDVGLSDDDRVKKWENDGYLAGREGKSRADCPHPDPNSLGARHWMVGYDKGQAENAKGIKPSKTAADEAPKKRGRPKKDAATAPSPEPAKPAPDPVQQTGEVRITYWHDIEAKRVMRIADGSQPPAGAVNLTKAEFEKLDAEYRAAEEDDWDAAAKKADEAPPAGDDDVDESESDEDEDPPTDD